MVFSSTVFLFLFLPVLLLLYIVIWKKLRNILLLIASLIFYAWGEKEFVLVMLVSIIFNYFFALLVEYFKQDKFSGNNRRIILALAIIFNIGLLVFFKYANFIFSNINAVFMSLHMPVFRFTPVHLPIGISFVTFHSLSYVIDIYRNQAKANKNPVNTGLYLSLFPQLIAGPIIRYHDIADQIVNRIMSLDKFYSGTKRFIIGLSKKVLIANTVGAFVDQIFSIPAGHLSIGLAWLGIIGYSLQIFFDFSAYSDMAIGLGRIFGFEFLENFNYPYISKSIKEFWRRWHISLSNWFRDYLYIPLGGNRCKPLRVYLNLLIVFFLCGLWHGASWTFVVWGLYHGLFLILERLKFGRILNSLWAPLQHFYALIVVMVGWVFFRADNFPYAISYIKTMFGFGRWNDAQYYAGNYLSRGVILAIILGIVFSMPLGARYNELKNKLTALNRKINWGRFFNSGVSVIEAFVLVIAFFICAMVLSSGTYNPFIYYRF